MWRLIACSNGAMSLLVVCFVCFLFFQKIVDSHSGLYPHSPATVHWHRWGSNQEFQDYYKDTYRQEWANGVPEMKMARDGKAYTATWISEVDDIATGS